MFGLFYLLFSLISSSQKCTYTSNLISIDNDVSLNDIKDELRPIFLRLTSPGCPYSPASNTQWIKAAELFPQVDFVTINCWKNQKICGLFGNSIMTPYHSLISANSTRVREETNFGNVDSISESPQKFIDIIQTYENLYPVSPPLVNLYPYITDSFYNNVPNPIFLLYDSLCSDQVPFLNAWTKIANEVIIPESDYPRIGMLDCSTYFDECQRWIRPYAPKTPIALIYSKQSGNFEVLENYKDIDAEKINDLYTNALSKAHREMPTPVPIPDSDPSANKPSFDGYTVIENQNLEGRSIETVKGQYNSVFIAPSSPCNDGSECGSRTLNKPGECHLIQPSLDDHTRSIGMVNFFRNLAGLLLNVTEDSEWNEQCLSAALNMHKLGSVPSNHIIDEKYAVEGFCGKAENIQVAQDSLLGENSKSAFMSSYKFFLDEGSHNDGIVGHRRWLLHPNLKKIGIGYYPYKEDDYGNYYMMKPSVTVFKIIENNQPGYIKESIPSNLNFISWPPAGPFPIDQLPSNWHISHSDFKNVILSDIKIYIERDDGAELKVKRINAPNDINRDTIVFQISEESLLLCQPMRKITVSVFNIVLKKLYRFSFELFGTSDLTEVCLYSSDSSKCPSSVQESNRFGPGNYQASIFATSNTNQVKVHVVEPITLNEPLSFTAKARFFISGSKLTGKINIGRNTVLDVQDPSLIDFSIDWSVKSNLIGKLETMNKAKSIYVVVSDNSEDVPIYDKIFYTGKQTVCDLSIFLFRGENKDVYFNFGGSEGKYFVSVSPTIAYELYSTVFDNEINNRANVKVLNSIFDLGKQTTSKRVIKVYTSEISKLSPINLSCFIPGKKRDYQFHMFGDAYLSCDMNISKVTSSLTFTKQDMYLSDIPYKFEVHPVDGSDPRNICPMDFVTINGAQIGTTYWSLPYVKGDSNAISAYKPSVNFDLYPNDEYNGGNIITAVPPKYPSPKKKCIITIPGVEDNYQVNFDFDVFKYNPVIIRPAAGTESKQVTISLYDLCYNIKVPDSPTTFQAYFENFQDLILDVPTLTTKGKSILPAYHFDNCGKVKFKKTDDSTTPVQVDHNITLSDIDYGFIVSTPSVKVTDSSSYDANNIQTTDLTVESKTTSTIKNIKVKESINVDSALVILDQCTLNENIKLSITRTENRWPSISLVNTDITPEVISIDLGIDSTSSSSLNLLELEDYECHILISGISSTNEVNKCEAIKNSVQVTNKGSFSIECSEDNTQLIAIKGKENAPVLLPEGAITPIPTPGDEVVETNVLLCNEASCNIVTDGKFNEYTIRVTVSSSTNPELTVSPAIGTDANKVTIKLIDSKGTHSIIPNKDAKFTVHFNGYKDLVIDNPIASNGESFVNCFDFQNCEKVSFINQENVNEENPIHSDQSLSLGNNNQIDYGVPILYPSCTVSQSGTYVTPNVQTNELKVPVSIDSTHVQLKITSSIKLDSSSVTLKDCKLNNDIEVTLEKSQQKWPSVSLNGTPFSPKRIIIDLKIYEQNLRRLVLESESHTLINGLSSDSNCDVILPKTNLRNAGNFKLKCSEDKLSILAKEEAPEQKPDIPDENPDVPVKTEEPENPEDSEEPSHVADTSTNANGGDEDDSRNEKTDKSFPVGAVIGIVCGVIAAIAIIVGIVLIVKKRKTNYASSSIGDDIINQADEDI